ncbi:hypothetical protein [Pelagivirga sediminicola]|uniref:hypothetical protein n=1 Tax=Pelagivirga sediminicola TaxID=2170575 RepID=UPI0014029867|nr:hypothetical protein [Pelagivirga sediminicola]
MLNIFAKSIMTAVRQPEPASRDAAPRNNEGHQGRRTRFDTRANAEIEAHLIARRRD